jgi:hypothetical protein
MLADSDERLKGAIEDGVGREPDREYGNMGRWKGRSERWNKYWDMIVIMWRKGMESKRFALNDDPPSAVPATAVC